MVISGIGMIFGLSKQKAGKAWGKPLATVCAVIALCCALAHIFMTSTGSSATKAMEIEQQYQKISGLKFGAYLANNYANSKVLVIMDPSSQKSDEIKGNPLLDGIKEGLGDKVTIEQVLYPELPKSAQAPAGPEGEMMEMMPPDMWFTASYFDNLIKTKATGCDLIISLLGMPTDPAAMKFWTMKNRPKLALARGSVYELKKAIASKAIVAVVSYNPDGTYELKAPSKDLDKAFDERFVLVTPENVEELATKYKGKLFGK
jgi:hypothetical protein